MKHLSYILPALLVALALPAQAHTKLVEAVPDGGAVLEQAPAGLRLSFSAEVELVHAAVKNGEGEVVNKDFTPPPQTAETFTVALPALNRGRYTVEWTVVGKEDGHTVLGDYSFTVE